MIIINVLWILLGIIQIFYPSIVLEHLAFRSSYGRGVPSLSPEPSFFGIFLFFISWIYLIRFNYQMNLKFKFIILANLLSILLLAKSSVVTLYLFITLFIHFIFSCNIKYKIFYLFFLGILLLALSNIEFYVGPSRILILTRTFYDDPLSLFFTDASSNQRLSNIVLPMHGLIYNHLIPGGFHSFSDVANDIISFYDGYFFYLYDGMKIMSWIGAITYELGFFGIVIIYIVAKNSYDGTKKKIFRNFTPTNFIIFSHSSFISPCAVYFFLIYVSKK